MFFKRLHRHIEALEIVLMSLLGPMQLLSQTILLYG
jgi:hypothetical protein